MIAIDNKLISEDIKEKQFLCDLTKCKGACCIEGESGAPLEFDELDVLEDEKLVEAVREYITPDGLKTIEEKGPFYLDEDDGVMKVTLKKDRACAFVNYKNGVTFCGIEKAWLEKKIDFRKPVSCHLYPIRIQSYPDYDALNYEKWDICAPACEHGKSAQIPLYQFSKVALIRKYGEEFYEKLEATVKFMDKKS